MTTDEKLQVAVDWIDSNKDKEIFPGFLPQMLVAFVDECGNKILTEESKEHVIKPEPPPIPKARILKEGKQPPIPPHLK